MPFRRLLTFWAVKDTSSSDECAEQSSLAQHVLLPMITIDLPSATRVSPVSIDQPLSLYNARMDPISPLLLLEPDVTPLLLRIGDRVQEVFFLHTGHLVGSNS
jgi:hypothetical protein